MTTTLLILLNLGLSLLALGAVAGALILARNLNPGPRHRWDLAYRRRPASIERRRGRLATLSAAHHLEGLAQK